MTDQINLRQRIEAAWMLSSSFTPERWEFENPAIGQCGVTALYVQSQLGGALYEGYIDEAKTKRHFFNCVQNILIDYTWCQFPLSTRLYHLNVIGRKDILANDWFVERYQNFLNNINNQI